MHISLEPFNSTLDSTLEVFCCNVKSSCVLISKFVSVILLTLYISNEA